MCCIVSQAENPVTKLNEEAGSLATGAGNLSPASTPAPSIEDILKPGESFAFASYLHNKCFARHWTIYEGRLENKESSEPLHRLIFLAEIDRELVGLGGPIVRIRANLICRSDLYPRFYRVETKEAVNIFSVGERACLFLPDGSEYAVTDTNFRCILGENLGQLMLYLKLAQRELPDSLHEKFFSLGGAAVFNYSLTPMAAGPPMPESAGAAPEGRWYRSSFLEELLISPDGWLVRHVVPKEGVVSLREDAPPPAWRDQPLVEKPISYSLPDGASFAIEDVKVPGPVVPVGTSITIPKGSPPYPVALFISGSGSHNRHGIAGQVDLGSHEIMDYLAENGWMGARFDTRGTGSTKLGEDFLEMGVDEIIADTRAVLHYILKRDDIDRNNVALIGHSQGGLLALELALEEPAVTRVVVMGMAGRSIEEILADQIAVRARWMGQTEEQLQVQLKDLEEFVSLARGNKEWAPDDVPDRFYVAKRLRNWYADHLERDPLTLIRRITRPLLICQGAKDFQVSAEKDAQALYHAAAEAGVPVELAIFDDLDHLFKPVEGESHVSQYYDLNRRVSVALLQRVLAFLNAGANMFQQTPKSK